MMSLAEAAASGLDTYPTAGGVPERPVVVLDLDTAHDDREIAALERIAGRVGNAAVIGVSRSGEVDDRCFDIADVVLTTRTAERCVVAEDVVATAADLVAKVEAHPLAALSLCWLLRAGEALSVEAGLVLESATYSMLLAAEDFGSWLAARGEPRAPGQPERVRLERIGDTLRLTACRVDRLNAMDTAMRDALLEGFAIAESDERVHVVWDAIGRSFGVGGDLDEFGSFADSARSHYVRIVASVGARIERMRDRFTARVHGPCYGSGIELPAFAGTVIADRSARFALPEVGMGVIPGAGGTASLPRRIGRHRTCWMGLSCREVDAETALAWGLVDELE